MGADVATCLADIDVCYVCMGSKDHITGLINNTVFGIGGNIINKLCYGLICALYGGCLLQSYFTKGHKDFSINRTCVVQETSNNFLDTFDAIGVQGRAWFRFSCILSLVPIIIFNMAIR